MPSHIYIRTGRYGDAADTNVRAVAVDEKYIREQNPQGVYAMMYYPHNIHFIYASAAFDGRSASAIEAADKLVGKIHVEMIPQMPMLEGFVPRPLFARLRFGKWEEILKQPAPPGGSSVRDGRLALRARHRLSCAPASCARRRPSWPRSRRSRRRCRPSDSRRR